MKKTVPFIMALCLGISLFIGRGVDSLAAADNISAENIGPALSEDGFRDCPKSGFEYQVPERFKDFKGQICLTDRGQTFCNSGIVRGCFCYVGKTAADENDEAYAMPFLYIVGAREDRTIEDAMYEALDGRATVKTGIIGRTGSYTYYYAVPDVTDILSRFKETCPEEMQKEYEILLSNAEQLVEGVSIKEPDPQIRKGTLISFETTDLEGNIVNSKDLFGSHKVTMINFWSNTCAPCIKELPELEALNKELMEKDCQIIGICENSASDDDSEIATMVGHLEESGVTYLHLVQTQEIREIFQYQTYPISFFVNNKGEIAAEPVTGAYFEEYKERIEEVLKEYE